MPKSEIPYTRQKLELSKTYNLILIIGSLVLLVSFLIILKLNRNLYASKLLLVKKLSGSSREMNNNWEETSVRISDETERNKGLIEQLELMMENEKLYLEPSITIQKVSERLDTNRTYLSKALNDILRKNFSKYINELRVQEAVGLINQGYTETHTIEALSVKVGFSSRAAFNTSFKEQNGVTPTFFIKNHKRQI